MPRHESGSPGLAEAGVRRPQIDTAPRPLDVPPCPSYI